MLNVRMTVQEHEAIKKAARAAGVDVSAYVSAILHGATFCIASTCAGSCGRPYVSGGTLASTPPQQAEAA